MLGILALPRWCGHAEEPNKNIAAPMIATSCNSSRTVGAMVFSLTGKRHHFLRHRPPDCDTESCMTENAVAMQRLGVLSLASVGIKVRPVLAKGRMFHSQRKFRRRDLNCFTWHGGLWAALHCEKRDIIVLNARPRSFMCDSSEYHVILLLQCE